MTRIAKLAAADGFPIYRQSENFGGFCLIFKYQLCPFGAAPLAKTVKDRLSLIARSNQGGNGSTISSAGGIKERKCSENRLPLAMLQSD